MLNIECNYFLWIEIKDFIYGYVFMIYKLWMEVGKYDFFYLNIFDLNFNSNVWRNFCK